MENINSKIEQDILVIDFKDAHITGDQYCLQLGNYIAKLVKETEAKGLLLDFERVQMFASPMIGQVISLRNKCKQQGLPFCACRIGDNAIRAVRLMRLEEIFDNHDCKDKAIEKLQSVAAKNGN